MSDQEATVEYRDVPEWPGYRVGTDGSVWTRRMAVRVPGTTGFTATLTDDWRQLLPNVGCRGYPAVSLRCDGRRLRIPVHRLVMRVFVGPRPKGKEVAHENGIKTDCRLDNLSYKTHRANAWDSVRQGVMPRGESHGHSKLTTEAVKAIREEHTQVGSSQRLLARRYGVSRGTIKAAIDRRTWTHV